MPAVWTPTPVNAAAHLPSGNDADPPVAGVAADSGGRDAPVSRRPRQLLVLIGVVLLVAFGGVAWLQSHTLNILRESVAERAVSLTFACSQLEGEYLRLVDLIERESLVAGSTPEGAISLRHELFVSRIVQVNDGGPDLLERIGHGKDPVRGLLQAYIAAADPLLAEAAPRNPPPSAADLAPLLRLLRNLAEPVHTLVLDAYHRDVQTTSERDVVVRSQHLTAVWLTLFQCLLTLAFAAIVAQQLRSAERRRQRLERLAGELLEARAQAEAASRAKSAFVANMSHELRTPFHGLLGMLSLIEDGTLGPEQQRRLAIARRSGDHLMSILNDVLDLARLESGEIGIDPSDTPVRQLFEDVLALMQPQAQAAGLALCPDLATDLPARLQIDSKRVRQILFNLIGNAIKFTPRGEVRVEVSVDERVDERVEQPADPSGPAGAGAAAASVILTVRVIDTGIGMDEAALARLFQRYAQGDASIQRRYGGTGLGLEISRTLARRMGGDLVASSRPGQGSTFCLTLRLQRSMAQTGVTPFVTASPSLPSSQHLAPPVEPPPEPAPWRVRPGVRARAGVRRALVCDDNPVNRLLMQAYLARCGCESVLCDDGVQAVALARCNAFDLIVMDLHMPGLDGLAAARQIRALQAEGLRPRIVVVTAEPLDGARKAATPAGVDELLAKPLSLADVEGCLSRNLGHEPGPDLGPDPASAP